MFSKVCCDCGDSFMAQHISATRCPRCAQHDDSDMCHWAECTQCGEEFMAGPGDSICDACCIREHNLSQRLYARDRVQPTQPLSADEQALCNLMLYCNLPANAALWVIENPQ